MEVPCLVTAQRDRAALSAVHAEPPQAGRGGRSSHPYLPPKSFTKFRRECS